jgi:ABC-type transporter Mla subunit MlaD
MFAMNAKLTKEQALRYAAQGLTVLAVLVAAVAVNLYFKLDELEATLSQVRAESDKANQAAATARKKLQDELNAAKATSAALEQRQREADSMKTLLAKMEPQLAALLEGVAGAKASKPEARAAALTSLGVIGQIARGANNEAALAALDRALAVDKANCVAGLAVNLGGARKVDVAPDCQALLPSAPAASEAKPAAEAKPDAAPAGGAAKAAPAAAKG